VLDSELSSPTARAEVAQLATARIDGLRGLGVDYASAPKVGVIGVGSGFVEGNDLTGLQASAMVGWTPGSLTGPWRTAADRFVFFANGIHVDLPELGVTASNVGAHVRVDVVPPKGAGSVSWTGLRARLQLCTQAHSAGRAAHRDDR